MSRASPTPEKSCLKRPRNAPSPGSADSDPSRKKHVTFGLGAEDCIPQEGQGMPKTKKPSLLPPITRPDDESDQIKLARKRTALCQKLLPVRKKILKWKKSHTEDAEDMDAERLAGMFLTGSSRADNEEDATLLKAAVGKMYRDILAQDSERKDRDTSQDSGAISDNLETAQEAAQLRTIEANTASKAKQSSPQATAMSNEGTDSEAENSPEHEQVKVADSRVCRTRNKKKWIIDSRSTVAGQLDLQHDTSLPEWRGLRTLHMLPHFQTLVLPRLIVDKLPAADGVWSLLTLLGRPQTATVPIGPQKELSIAKATKATDYGLQDDEEWCNNPSNETQKTHQLLVFHHGRPVGILAFESPASRRADSRGPTNPAWSDGCG